jgi:hypothetical protein
MQSQSHVDHKPLWVTIVRGFQFLFAIIILGLAGYIIHGKYFNEMGFAIVCVSSQHFILWLRALIIFPKSLFTWLIVAYILTTEKVPSLHQFHNIYAVLGADAFMVVFWLSSMAAAAALRGTFKYNVNIESCSNDGSLVNSSTCVVSKRAAVATDEGLGVMSGVAGLSALNMWVFGFPFLFRVIRTTLEFCDCKSQRTICDKNICDKNICVPITMR